MNEQRANEWIGRLESALSRTDSMRDAVNEVISLEDIREKAFYMVCYIIDKMREMDKLHSNWSRGITDYDFWKMESKRIYREHSKALAELKEYCKGNGLNIADVFNMIDTSI